MKETNTTKAGVNRTYGKSLTQKLVFGLIHMLSILLCVWLVYFNGWTTLGSLFEGNWSLADPMRAQILLAAAFIYWLRHLITLFYLLVRRVDWSEVLGLSIFIALFEIGLLLLGGGAFRNHVINLNWLDLVALILFLLGSFLNSYSEMQRKWWKNNPANKGHCYTKGLFSYSMHINYFGDVVLFSGWCLFTHNLWTLCLPLAMALMFVFSHIPGLDSHLTNKYGKEFEEYAKKTKRFIPFIY